MEQTYTERTMFLQLIFLLVQCIIQSEGIIDDRSSQGIHNISNEIFSNETVEIKLNLNSIAFIPASYLKNLPLLERVDIWSNQISVIEDFSFVNVPTLLYLTLQNNMLSILTSDMFKGLFRFVPYGVF